MRAPGISVIITAHNEGAELARTLESVIHQTRGLVEAIVVDDGSNDGSCDRLSSDRARVVRHERRIGVAFSRDEGSRLAAGDVIAYLDGHQRLSRGCLDRCARLAIERQAIVGPDIRDYGLFAMRLHGAQFRLCPEKGFLSARWRTSLSRRLTRVTALRAPPYVLPRSLYDQVAWSPLLRGWGASEASLALKAFFLKVDILHLKGPAARHRFQQTFAYPTTWETVWRNQALIVRVCFDDASWFGYWLPQVFGEHLSDETKAVLESPELASERRQFAERKRRSDREFWTDLVGCEPPAEVAAPVRRCSTNRALAR